MLRGARHGHGGLFCVGLVLVTASDGAGGVSTDCMRPVCLEPVGCRFPNRCGMVAPVGTPWYEDAATLVRFDRNWVADWTGSGHGKSGSCCTKSGRTSAEGRMPWSRIPPHHDPCLRIEIPWWTGPRRFRYEEARGLRRSRLAATRGTDHSAVGGGRTESEIGVSHPSPAHTRTAEQVCCDLEVDPSRGLAAAEARWRLVQYGPNRLEARRGRGLLGLWLDQFRDFMVLVLVGAAAISFVLKEVPDGLAILVILLTNAVLGTVQESRAERSLDALRQLVAPRARVLRDGVEQMVSADTVVPGDVLLLEAGDRVPADARLIEVHSLAAEESALTGESHPTTKQLAALSGISVPLAERTNMLYQGSYLVRGRGVAVTTACGMQTEVGRIARLLHEAGDAATPLERRLDQLGRWLVVICLAVSCAVVTMGVLRGEPPYRMFLAGVSLAVAAIPEGLPAIVTIALALGVQRMIRKNAIVRQLPAVETLGCATVICSDKTGTLTQNRMVVQAVLAGGRRYREWAGADAQNDALLRCERVALLCNNAWHGDAQGNPPPSADPTEWALGQWAADSERLSQELEGHAVRTAEVPFSSERRRMAVIVREGDHQVVMVKGALEDVLLRCTQVALPDGRAVPLDAHWTSEIRREGERMAQDALRVLALADRRWPGDSVGLDFMPEDHVSDIVEVGLTFVGLVGMMDPPRPEVPASIRRCQRAGIRVVMITGDHALTARAVACRIGLIRPSGRVVTGNDLAVTSDRDLRRLVSTVSVYARVSPTDKLRIVEAMRSAGEVVAMTGDGVNDAPAVKEADIGIAMGRSGTDVTREASGLILVDDNFATIVSAVEEGRAIYENIRKFVRYLLACNTGEVLVMLGGTLLGLSLPLLPLQLLLINLVTDGLPALALGVDPPVGDVMDRPPRSPRESVFARGLGKRIVSRGVVIGLLTLGMFVFTDRVSGSVAAARTAATATLVLSQLLHALDARAEGKGLWEIDLLANRVLLLAIGSSLLILLAVTYLPALRSLFDFVAPSSLGWGLIVGASLLGAAASGLGEVFRRAWRRRTASFTVRRLRRAA